MNAGLGKRPRHYADEIVVLATAAERRDALRRVPEVMRATTRKHVKLALDTVAIARHVYAIAHTRGRQARCDRLDQVPAAIRERVRRGVILVMKAERAAA